jgi:hypothetical protein
MCTTARFRMPDRAWLDRPVRPPTLTIAAVSLAAHVRRDRLDAAEVADHLGVEVGEQRLRVGVRHVVAHQAGRRRGAVDEDVDAAQPDGRRGEPPYGLGVGRVGGDGRTCRRAPP